MQAIARQLWVRHRRACKTSGASAGCRANGNATHGRPEASPIAQVSAACAGATAPVGSPKSPTFTLAGQIAELQVLKQKNLNRGRNLGILSLLAALAIMFLIYSVYSRTVLAYAVLENIEIEQDPDAETQITVSFDVKIPGMVAFDRRSGTGHTEKLDMITVAEHRGTVWSWPSDPKTGIDFSVVSRGGWFRTRMDKHFGIHGEEVTPEDDGRTVLEAEPDPGPSTAPKKVVAVQHKKDEKRKPAGCRPFACWTFEADARDAIGTLHGSLFAG